MKGHAVGRAADVDQQIGLGPRRRESRTCRSCPAAWRRRSGSAPAPGRPTAARRTSAWETPSRSRYGSGGSGVPWRLPVVHSSRCSMPNGLRTGSADQQSATMSTKTTARICRIAHLERADRNWRSFDGPSGRMSSLSLVRANGDFGQELFGGRLRFSIMVRTRYETRGRCRQSLPSPSCLHPSSEHCHEDHRELSVLHRRLRLLGFGRQLAGLARADRPGLLRGEEPAPHLERQGKRQVEGAARAPGQLDAGHLGRQDLPHPGQQGRHACAACSASPAPTASCSGRRTSPTRRRNGTGTRTGTATPRPPIDGERVVVSFGSAGMYCYDFDGKELWKRTDLGKWEHAFGNGVVARAVRRPGHPLVRAERRQGPQLPARGRTRRPARRSGNTTRTYGSWSTPLIAKVDGQDQLLLGMSAT